MNCSPIHVLIVENSPSMAKILTDIVNSDPKLKVISCFSRGEEALYLVQALKPDVIVMDMALPNMDGFETTRKIMEKAPVPIIIVSTSFHQKDTKESFRAFLAGALEIIKKPSGLNDPAFDTLANALIKSIKNAAIIKLTTRHYFHKYATQVKEQEEIERTLASASIRGIAIGSSLGGPKALNTIFSQLSTTFPIPIFVVQHIAAGFHQGFVDWIQKSSSLKITLAQEGMLTQPGYVYIAPENFHLELTIGQKIHLSNDLLEEGLRPSVGRLFRSMAKIYGKDGMGIILTGMGHDGAADLLSMKTSGAITIAQDQESSFIFGMPKEAIVLGAAQFVLSLQQIIAALNFLANKVQRIS